MTDRNMYYDHISSLLMTSIKNVCIYDDSIELHGFNYDNKEHQYLLYLAVMGCLCYGKRLKIDANLFIRLKIYHQYKSNLRYIKRAKKNSNAITVSQILEDMRPYACELFNVNDFDFNVIFRYIKEI